MWFKKYLKMKDLNCAEFVEYVLNDHFKTSFRLPQSEGSIFYQSYLIKKNLPNYCERTENPADGDIVLMHGIRRMCHIGIYVKNGITPSVLHTEKKLKTSALHKLREISLFGYTVEGFYTWQR